MFSRPEETVTEAYRRIAADDYAGLRALLAPSGLRIALLAKVRAAMAIAEREGARGSTQYRRALIEDLGTYPPENIEDTDVDVVLRHGFARLPEARASVSVRIAETEYVSDVHAVVHFWASLPSDNHPPLRSLARLSLVGDTWMIWPDPYSDWIVPGMENRVFYREAVF